MAFNWETFKTRTLTAAVFAAVMLAGLFVNPWLFLILFSVIHFGCWWEYLKLIEKINQAVFHIYTKLGLMLIGYGIMLWFCGSIFEISGYRLKDNLSLPVSAAGFALMLIGIFQKNTVKLKSFVAAALGLLYISLSWGLMMALYKREIPYGQIEIMVGFYFIPFLIIVCMWVNDTMAYIVGSLIGKTPFSKISPKKTWEGTIGGAILCVFVVGFFVQFLLMNQSSVKGRHIEAFHWYVIAGIAAITGTAGDLLESKLKRMAGVKDSGSLMPGHGGFLDRFDSLLLATPFVWLYINLAVYQ